MTPEKKEILDAYELFWITYFSRGKGVMEKVLSLMHPQVSGIGSGNDEIARDMHTYKQFIQREFQEVKKSMTLDFNWSQVSLHETMAIVIGEAVLSIDPVANIKMHFRCSSVFKKHSGKWKLLHSHISLPASGQADNESFPVDALKARNEKLQKQVAEKTAALLKKNRELEIEAALERVRARTMAMHKSEELSETASVLFHELKRLGIESFRNGVCIIDFEKDSAELWLSTEIEGKTETRIIATVRGDMHPMYKAWFEAGRQKKPLFIQELNGMEVVEYYKTVSEYLQLPAQKVYNKKEVYHGFYFNEGTLNVISLKRLSEDECSVMQRFARVFGMLYRRFLDLKQAEEQAREAQIEAALERIRSRALSMHYSTEVGEVSNLLYNEFEKMDIPLMGFNIVVQDKVKDLCEMWRARQVAIPSEFESFSITAMYDKMDHYLPGFTVEFEADWKKGKPYHIAAFKGQRRISFLKANRDIYNYSNDQFQKMKDIYPEPIVFHMIFFKQGWLGVSKHEYLNENDLAVSHRFAEVFEFAYTRFLDLQKAEAQAREAQIEAALEKVRSRSLAMHKSSELQDVVNTVFEKLKDLEINMNVASIFIFKEGSKDWEQWVATATTSYATYFHIPYIDNLVFRDLEEAKQKRKDFYSVRYSFEQKNEWFKYAFKKTEYRQIPDRRKKYILESEFFLVSFAISDHSGIQLAKYEGRDFSQEENKVLKRFSRVFEQAYTRFLDLKKAEAQAREAEIQLALERVRARTMAMHDSNELLEAGGLLYKELQKLGIESLTSGYVLMDDSGKMGWSYLANPADGTIMTNPFGIPHNETKVMRSVTSSWKKQEPYSFIELDARATRDHQTYIAQHSINFKLSADELLAISPENLVRYNFNFKHGYLLIISGRQLEPEQIEIMLRCAKVFEMTYLRFLDLKKAEAQAREAQIEAALEKVRSRTMGMQKSEELKEVIQLVYEQFVHLNIHIEHTGFIMDYKARDDMHIWLADQNGAPSEITIPFFDSPHWNSFVKAKEEGMDFFANRLTFEEKNRFYKKLFTFIPGLPEKAKEFYFACPGLAVSTVLLDNVGLYIENFSGIPYTDEENDTLMRFGKVFQQTYTRFLDLQKAETQAREAQIETALERVRTRTMTMKKSSELSDVVAVLYQQMAPFGLATWGCEVILCDQNSGNMEYWHADLVQSILPQCFYVSKKDHPVFQKQWLAWKKQQPLVIELSAGKKKHFDLFLFSKTDFKKLPDNIKKEILSKKEVVFSHACLKHGLIEVIDDKPLEDEKLLILKRFAAVFEQTYTRFLDLQRAEAQARESQIEAALERVRFKAMAMHSSDDLAETVDTFFSELTALNVTPHRCGVGIIDDISRTVDIKANTTTHSKKIKKMTGKLNLYGHPVLNKIFENWKLQKEYHPVLKGKEIIEYYNVMNPQITFPDFADDKIQYGHYFFFKEGGVFTWTDKDLSEDDLQIFRRYTSVLSLTYRRYLDLKETEAQAQEAKIEVALERVRSRTMAMHNSHELAETAAVVFEQLKHLAIEPNRIYIAIIKENAGSAEFWITDEDGSKVSSGFTVNFSDNITFKKIYRGWKEKKKSIIIDMKDVELKTYFKYLDRLGVSFKGGLSQKRRLQYIAYYSQGFIGVASPDETNPHTLELLERFAAVFNLTYTRFNDLLQSEAQNKIILAENERKTKELEEARHLQLSMLPNSIPTPAHLDIAVYMKTATEVGGDYYDFAAMEDGTLNICLGDATGHGLKAGIMVSSMKSIFTTNAPKMDIEDFFETANSGIKSMNLRRLMMGLVMLNVNMNSYKLINAGMPPVFHYHKKTTKVTEIKDHGLPVGAMNNYRYTLFHGSLEKGDALLLISDGMPELQNEKGVMYGYNRIRNLFRECADNKSQQIVNHMKKTASKWVNDQEPDDDVTFVVIKVK